ncbi:MAG: flippase [Syntrophotaleaceae bacterium]
MSKILADKKFSEILTGSAFALTGKMSGVGLALLSNVLVARFYGASMMGVLAIVQAFMMMASIFAVMGTNVSILRLIPEHLTKYSVTSAFNIYRKTQYLVAVTSLLVGGALYFCSNLIAQKVFTKPDLNFYIAVTALSVIFKALMDLNTEAVRGLRLIRIFAFMQILPHAMMLLILLALMAISKQPNDPFYAQLAAWGATAITGALIMDRAFRCQMRPDDQVRPLKLVELLSISAPMLMTASMNFIIGQVGVLVLGVYRPASEVGFYAIAVKLATLTSFVLQAINSMAAPKFSELFHTGKLDDLFYVAKKSTRLIFWTTTPILLFLVVFGRPILALFGEDFTVAYLPMLILVVGQFVNSVSGSTGYFMNMTGQQKAFRNIIAISSSINIFLTLFLIPKFGLLGAALAGTSSMALWNCMTLFFIKIKFGKTIGYIPWFKNFSSP